MDDELRKDLIGAIAPLIPGWTVVILSEGDHYRMAQERERRFLGRFKLAPERLPIVDLRQEGADWTAQTHLGTGKDVEALIKKVFLAHGKVLGISRFRVSRGK